MSAKFYIIIPLIIASIIIIALVSNNKSTASEHVSVKELVSNPLKYKDKSVIVNGIITEIFNGDIIYALWNENRMVELNIPVELNKQLVINTNVEVEGFFRTSDDSYWIDVKDIKRL